MVAVPADDAGLEALLLELYTHERKLVALHPDATRRTLDALGRPDARVPAAQIAGTNGKGSVSCMVAAGAAAAGRRVGLFTSPHLVDWRERVQFWGPGPGAEWIGRAEALGAIRAALGAAEVPLTFFEVTTVAALWEMARAGVDLAVLEVGLGGRLDSTSAVAATVGAVVTIGRDHMEVLGETEEAIAREKAGIAKPGMKVVSGVGGPTGAVVSAEVAARGGRVAQLGVEFRYETRPRGGAIAYEGPRWRLDEVRVAMAGAHQRHNAAVALRVLEELAAALPALGLDARRAEVAAAAGAARWPGRFEVLAREGADGPDGDAAAALDAGGAVVVLDAAHNPDGAAALARTLGEELAAARPRRVHLVLGAMGDKDARGLLAPLLPLVDEATFVRAPGARAQDPAALCRVAAALRPDLLARSAGDTEPARVALDVLRAAADDDLVLVAGSIYLLGAVRPALRTALGLG